MRIKGHAMLMAFNLEVMNKTDIYLLELRLVRFKEEKCKKYQTVIS